MSEKTYAERIEFVKEEQIMEVDFSDLTFDVAKPVNAIYDELDRRMSETGRKWFFLVNYKNCTIMAEAWITFAHRGKKLNLKFSLGTARYAATGHVAEAVRGHAMFDHFDANLYPSREAALEFLRSQRAQIPDEEFEDAIRLEEDAAERSNEERITFHPDLNIMEADFSDITFERSADVNAFYDLLEQKIKESGRRWYFIVNYRNCSILPEAWVAFSTRGKKVNLAYSLGTVRFDASQETARSIEADSRRESFDANLLESREAAVHKIVEMSGGLEERRK